MKYGPFEFMLMPMILRNAPVTFQTLMNSLFYDCIDRFVVVYLYDLSIYSNSIEDHIELLENVLSSLHENQLFAGN